MVRIALKVTAILALTYLLTRYWFGSGWSEQFWTWLNHHLSAGENPGLASDIEFIIVLAVAVTGSIIISHVLFHLAKKRLKRNAN